MIILLIILTLVMASISLSSWKRHSDNKFLMLFWAAVFVLIFNIWSYLSSNLLFVSSVLTYLLIACESLYHWKKIKERFLFYVFFASLFIIITTIYHSFGKEALGISAQIRSVISFVIIGFYVILAIGLIKNLISSK